MRAGACGALDLPHLVQVLLFHPAAFADAQPARTADALLLQDVEARARGRGVYLGAAWLAVDRRFGGRDPAEGQVRLRVQDFALPARETLHEHRLFDGQHLGIDADVIRFAVDALDPGR